MRPRPTPADPDASEEEDSAMPIRQLIHRRLRLPTALLLFGALVLSGGGVARGAADEGLLPGQYATTLTEEEFPEFVPAATRAALAGSWWLYVEEDGRYTIYDKTGREVVEGVWRRGEKGDMVTLTDERGPLACWEPGQESGTYRWARRGDALRFTVVADACLGRMLVLTLPVYQSG
jgi:hypothetical protein